jgi:CheY-like chemotaxis protein
MRDKRKILIIENQITQFKKIRENCREFDVFPSSDEDFLSFITWVRRYVYEKYPDRALDISKIIEKAKEVELILMDYKLGAQYNSLSGISLAKDINLKLQKSLPVVFMSKDHEHTKEIAKELKEYEEKGFPTYKWVHKGYFGNEILEPDYFKEIMIPSIKYCFLDSSYQQCINIINRLLDLPHSYTEENRERVKILKDIKDTILETELKIKPTVIEHILELKGCKNYVNIEINKIQDFIDNEANNIQECD